MLSLIVHTVEPPVSDHPKWSLIGGGRLQESNHRRPLPRRGTRTSVLWKMIYCMQFLIKLGHV